VNEKLLNRIISVAYGDSSLLEKIKIRRLAKTNPEIKALLDTYSNTAEKTHRIELEQYHNNITEEIKRPIIKHNKYEKSLGYDFYSFVFGRPALSAAILSIIILALISTFVFQRPEIHEQYSKQEIEAADLEVKQSLALIANVFKKTTSTVENEVLTERVSKPIKESLNLVNNYFEGDKNENIN